MSVAIVIRDSFNSYSNPDTFKNKDLLSNTKDIIENILGNNFLTRNYLKDTINLTKSIVIKNNKEARLVNDFIRLAYPSYSIDETDKTTWRYYKHLNAEYHELDTDIYITSLDNGSTVLLNKTNINNHVKTKNELLKFDLYYRQIVEKHKEQELYIKACITDNIYSNINDIISLEDFTITSYNKQLVETQEHNLIELLSDRITNYKNIWLIPYYSISDSLFLATQYVIFYQFILKSIIGIRLKNAKTTMAHSYHIKNYLASHHYLDEYYNYLNTKQLFYLYKNLLYLDNHSGSNLTFNSLIDNLLTERNITIVTYDKNQKNSINDDYYVDYKFNQRLLNNKNLVYSLNDFNLDSIRDKEYNLAPSNSKELTYNLNSIDFRLKNTLFSKVLTKDLESIIVDNTDAVRYKFIPILIDYWAYLLKTNRIDFLVDVVNPSSNTELKLNTSDLFKLFIITLFKINNITLTEFPDYTIKRVFKPTLPSNSSLLSLCYRKYYWFDSLLNTIKQYIPSYINISTSYQYQSYIEYIYKLEIGLWLLLTNFDDKDVNGQFELIIDRLHYSDIYIFNNETVNAFLTRIGLTDLFEYDNNSLDTLIYNILNNLYNNKLNFLNSYKYIQKTLIEVFKKFNSYTVQFINDYYVSSPILAGIKDTRQIITQSVHDKLYYYNMYFFNIGIFYKIKNNLDLSIRTDYVSSYRYNSNLVIDISSNTNIKSNIHNKVSVLFTNKIIIDLDSPNWVVSQSSEEDLLFLAFNN